MKVFKNGVDEGYLEDQNWWLNPNHQHSFLIQPIEDNYPNEYFKEDHISQDIISACYRYIKLYYQALTRKELNYVIEFGCGGGWIVDYFQKMGIRTIGYEGSVSGVISCGVRGAYGIYRVDLRTVIATTERYDMAICVEVAEHIEIPFSSIFVRNLIKHADLIWFSTEEPNTNKPHIHHPNERPYKFWINLFDFYDYGCYMLPDEVYIACQGRGRMIFYNRKTIVI